MGVVTVYLTVFALFLIVICVLTGGIEIYNYGTVYIRITNPMLFGIAIMLAILDFVYELIKFLLKFLVKQEEKQTPENLKET
jgi:hypothetical protein